MSAHREVSHSPFYHYIVVRRDLPPGVVAAQVVHAAGESAAGLPPLPENTHAVVLAVPDEDRLLWLAHRLTRAGIAHKLIREPDAPYNGAATALGIPPQPRENLRRLLSSLPLFT